MNRIHYKIVQHDGGWAYQLDNVFSETFPTHDAALHAAQRVVHELQIPGETVTIEFQDASGVWRTERAESLDRPQADVTD